MKLWQNFKEHVSLLLELIKTSVNLWRGVHQIKKLSHSPVTIFGSARLKRDNIFIRQAHEMAHLFMKHGIPVITGGGSGIMEAAECGATELQVSVILPTLGIGVPGIECRCCGAQKFTMRTLFARKYMLIQYSIGFVVFPGGFGTVNEFTELMTLMQLNMLNKVPVVLVGRDYWNLFIRWINESAIPQGIILSDELSWFKITDDTLEAFEYIMNFKKK